MQEPPLASIGKHFAEVQDPRIDLTKAHLLFDIVVMAIWTVICGAETGVHLAEYLAYLPNQSGWPALRTIQSRLARRLPFHRLDRPVFDAVALFSFEGLDAARRRVV